VETTRKSRLKIVFPPFDRLVSKAMK